MAFSEVCRNRILSESYEDFIVGENWNFTGENSENEQLDYCFQSVDRGTRIEYIKNNITASANSSTKFYPNIPKLYVPLSTSALEASGILQAAAQPGLDLQGQGVIIAVADTGIDYTHPAFLNEIGNSKIISIWDQTVQTGIPPEGFDYGTEYTREQINEAIRQLNQPDRMGIENQTNQTRRVETTDSNGHGTYVAGVAAGSRVVLEGKVYQGAAPMAELAIVKLKPAKRYLKEYYQVPENAEVYQENDIMLAMRYFLELQQKTEKPVVICVALGTNTGGHDGGSPLGFFLERLAREYQMAVITATGNEAVAAHHYYGRIASDTIPDVVELQVAEQESGFTMEIWPDQSELITISVISPSGQRTEKFVTRLGVESQIQFILEGTRMTARFWFDPSGDGNQIISLKFLNPVAGIWKIQVYSILHYGGGFHIWLPITGLIRPETIFLKPDINVTLTEPSAGEHVIAIGGYNHVTGSIYIFSGRGKNRTGQQQPTLTAPAVEIDGPVPGSVSGYGIRTGTSAAAAITAGAAASLFTWGVVNKNLPAMTGTTVKFFLIAGAKQLNLLPYPNEEWGYGALDLYRIFQVLANLQL